MASLAKSYEQYSKFRNVTFVGVNVSTLSTLEQVERQVNQYGLKPFANLHDPGGVTAAAYHVSPNTIVRLVLVDAEGKIAWNCARMWSWSSGEHAGKTIMETQFEEAIKKAGGILDIKGVPEALFKAGHLFDLQQFDKVEEELRQFGSSGDAAVKDCMEKMRGRIDKIRAERVAAIEKLAEKDALQAYRDAEAFVKAFPDAPEKSDVVKLARKLARDAVVKQEIKAEAAFHRILVPEMKKARTTQMFFSKVMPLLRGYLKTYGKTKFAETAKASVEAYGEALGQ